MGGWLFVAMDLWFAVNGLVLFVICVVGLHVCFVGGFGYLVVIGFECDGFGYLLELLVVGWVFVLVVAAFGFGIC